MEQESPPPIAPPPASEESALGAQELEEAKAQVEVAVERAEEIQRTFWAFKAEVARSAQNSRKGKTIPLRLIAEIEAHT